MKFPGCRFISALPCGRAWRCAASRWSKTGCIDTARDRRARPRRAATRPSPSEPGIPCNLLPQADLGHERHPALHLGGVVLGKFLRAEPGRLEPDGTEFFLNVGLLDDSRDGAAERGANVLRH